MVVDVQQTVVVDVEDVKVVDLAVLQLVLVVAQDVLDVLVNVHLVLLVQHFV